MLRGIVWTLESRRKEERNMLEADQGCISSELLYRGRAHRSGLVLTPDFLSRAGVAISIEGWPVRFRRGFLIGERAPGQLLAAPHSTARTFLSLVFCVFFLLNQINNLTSRLPRMFALSPSGLQRTAH